MNGGEYEMINKYIVSISFMVLATFLINITGAFLLGYIIGDGVSTSWQLLLGTGFMGAFTTFSTFKLETIQLFNLKQFSTLLLYVSTTYIIGILFAFLGMQLGGI